jgi:magnesium-transporting ATPase (P-type)
MFNCEARIEMDEHAYYVPTGNGTEVGLIRFLQDAEVPVHEIIKRKLNRIQATIPFSTIKKRSVVAMSHPDNEELVRIYVKGAPEAIVSKCVKTFDIDGSKIMMSDEQLGYILQNIVSEQFTSKGLRTLAFAYKDMSFQEFNNLRNECNNFKEEADREALEGNLTFLGVFALHDDLRDRVLRSVQYAQKGNIVVRMVSGDNLETATQVAIRAGIITEEEAKVKYTCMPAEEFRKMVGGMRRELDGEGNQKMYIQNKKEFQQIANRLKVLSRAIPYDKHLLVVGLKELNRAVAVTGDGINDADALRASDVGFAMGSGCSVAKDSSDMILIEDNFESTMKAVMWGRNIYDNVRRFLQF